MSSTAPLLEVTDADMKPVEERCLKARELVAKTVATPCQSNRRTVKCLNCAKRLPSPSALFLHILVHTDEKPFICKVVGCCKGYTSPRSLWHHYSTHRMRGEIEWKRFDEFLASKEAKGQSLRWTRPVSEKDSAKRTSSPVPQLPSIAKDEQFHLTSKENNEFWKEVFANEAERTIFTDDDVSNILDNLRIDPTGD